MGLLEAGLNFLKSKSSKTTNLYHVDKINEVYGIEWDFNNQFIIKDMNNEYLSKIKGIASLASLFEPSVQGINDGISILNRHIVNVTFPALTTSTLESWIGSYWQYTTGRPVVGQMIVTFTDYDNYTLYNEFLAAFNVLHDSFPTEQMWNITISKILPKQSGRSLSTLKPLGKSVSESDMVPMIKTKTAMLESISELHFDQSNANALSTFEVTFKLFEVG